MPADVIVNLETGPAGSTTLTDVTSLVWMFSLEDEYTVDGLDYPVLIPDTGAGDIFAYWRHNRLYGNDSPATVINGITVFSDGSNDLPPGVTVLAQVASTGADAGYREAPGTLGETGTELNETNHTGLDDPPEDFFSWTAAAPKSVPGSLSNPDTGAIAAYIVTQAVVADDGTATETGASGTEPIYVAHDET